jgi:transketolase
MAQKVIYMVDNEEIKRLESISEQIRFMVVDVVYRIGAEYKAHVGGALSIVDMITCLYFNILNIDPKNPKWQDRDRFILSKGHACTALYVALALREYYDRKHLYVFRHIESILQGHPDMKKTPGIDMTAGSLGNGLGAGVGMALAARLDSKNYRTYVMLGDGEIQEGVVWEAAMTAGHYKLNNLIAIIDRNRLQSTGSVESIMNVEPLADKFKSFNWDVVDIDGHSVGQIVNALTYHAKEGPLAVIANTIKGKGISFMEEDNSWHQRAISDEEYLQAMKDLKRGNANGRT